METTELYVDVQYFSPNRQHPHVPGRDQTRPNDREHIERIVIPRLCAGVLMLNLVRAWRRGQGPRSWQQAVLNPDNRWLWDFEQAFGEGGIRLPDTDVLRFEFEDLTISVEPVARETGEGSWYEWVKCKVTLAWKNKFARSVAAGVMSAVIAGHLIGGSTPPLLPERPVVCSVQIQVSHDTFLGARDAAVSLLSEWPAKISWRQQDDRIRLVQTQLNRLRPASVGPIDVDGIWGEETERLARAVFSTASHDLRRALDMTGYASDASPHRAMNIVTNRLVAERILLDSWLCGSVRY